MSRRVEDFKYHRLDIQRDINARKVLEDDLKGDDQEKQRAAMQKADDEGQDLLDNLRISLWEKHPVSFGFTFYKPNDSDKDKKYFEIEYELALEDLSNNAKWLVKEIPKDRRHIGPDYAGRPSKPTGDWSYGVHAILAIGFIDDKTDLTQKSGWVLCQTSWGSDSAMSLAPTFLLPYSWITDFRGTRDFWMMDLSAKKPEEPPKTEDATKMEKETNTEDVTKVENGTKTEDATKTENGTKTEDTTKSEVRLYFRAE